MVTVIITIMFMFMFMIGSTPTRDIYQTRSGEETLEVPALVIVVSSTLVYN